MKKLCLILLLIISFISLSSVTTDKVKIIEPKLEPLIILPPAIIEYEKDTLLEALVYVESRGNHKAVGDNGKAIGCLQIWPIMVREVNRHSKTKFTLEDRWDCEKSKQMFNIWKEHYHSDSSAEKIARNWNGGPNGYKKPSTKHYWNKVKSFFKNNNKNA